METALAEMPLALFSTLAPMGAGAFAALAAVFTLADPDEAQTRRIDRATALPLALMLAGFGAATLHLASPGRALGVLAGVGSSPLSDEVAAGAAFALLAAVCWVWALSGRMSQGTRHVLVCVLAVGGLVFAAAIGTAYLMDTIPSWNTPAVPVSLVGFALAGGAAVGLLAVGMAGCGPLLAARAPRLAMTALAVGGLVLGMAGAGAQLTAAAGMTSPLAVGADLVGGVAGAIVIGAAGLSSSAACVAIACATGRRAATLGALAAALAFAGILALRLAFYATQLSAGLAWA
ncbi:dimethyl sulfoxide reductase anchor subunit family protein [Adlercreutzia faecimuris]|uniref:Dimethyl sulfoxide reductase anchor subunit n=1 Tax=Adlercreutzia faecimuris TaxID=2897341 RepID=A0ABS9WJQ5_9ACTN|nr:DmsC/YnfH family molybdoenzyme membrane anchor subunit [Adlercreutzia sp. JBNU-10]MCI2242542.1 dimethyl sulfoxide reductase anchor subunit [Adlercreutzia sp. JBNU-10]